MKFLVDHQLPFALVHFLMSEGHSAEHVEDAGLAEAQDFVIWNHALAHKMVVVSKDEDFVYLAQNPGSVGQLVWVRIGNCRNSELLAAFSTHLPRIISVLETGANLIELR